jgi:hypothetical protein
MFLFRFMSITLYSHLLRENFTWCLTLIWNLGTWLALLPSPLKSRRPKWPMNWSLERSSNYGDRSSRTNSIKEVSMSNLSLRRRSARETLLLSTWLKKWKTAATMLLRLFQNKLPIVRIRERSVSSKKSISWELLTIVIAWDYTKCLSHKIHCIWL